LVSAHMKFVVFVNGENCLFCENKKHYFHEEFEHNSYSGSR
jgi:hypothetical protein